MSWAEKATPIVAKIIRTVGRGDMKALRKALTDAYPWGARKYAPYKAWRGEVRRQLGHPLNTPRHDPANPQVDLFS
ncbi:hypothetical protein [Pseudomonas mosselii]|uniref:hypothetical protein n=1 Tax=Pseudomonas mosselii TaxID=78327 RepID=UPI0021DA2386|nr:hypothetical protein [Pseudomonas mosselii]MCU9527605.1 hypothetical protein [Pseudomonas mosselii]MCU9534918.1 hypothetical protein [Pseudomonas mosselii]MCU9542421.1 hypothetical protein [Pseudomonas mosselii]MCU9546758.1 hypothetical protein [Pseudomonas mosselii]